MIPGLAERTCFLTPIGKRVRCATIAAGKANGQAVVWRVGSNVVHSPRVLPAPQQRSSSTQFVRHSLVDLRGNMLINMMYGVTSPGPSTPPVVPDSRVHLLKRLVLELGYLLCDEGHQTWVASTALASSGVLGRHVRSVRFLPANTP